MTGLVLEFASALELSLFYLSCGLLAVQAVILAINVAAFPVLTPGRPTRRPQVSLLVPARNEAANLPLTLPLLLAQDAHEVIVLDDASDDGTAAVLADFAMRFPRLQVLSGQPLPRGWNGKNWACQQLAAAAGGDLLVFTDADVRWQPGALDALLAFLERQQAGLVSVWPRQLTASWLERRVVPLIDLILLTGLPYPAVRRCRAPSLAAGNGQVMAFRRDAYAAAGGHRAVRSEVLEDVALARRVKAQGIPLALALGGELLATRMYRSAAALYEGFAKSLLAAVGYQRAALVGLMLLTSLAYSFSWPLALLEPRWLVPAVLGVVLRGVSASKGGRSPLEGLLQPLALLPCWRIGIMALRRGRSYRWKGRTYP